HFFSQLFAEVDDVEGLADVERALAAVRAFSLVVVDAVGDVGLFHDFAEHDAVADGVHGARGNVNRVAGSDGNARDEGFERAVVDGAAKFFRGDAGPQVDQELGAGAGGEDVPHLRFSAAAAVGFVLGGVGIVGVDLNRGLFPGEQEFHEDGDLGIGGAARAFPLHGHLAPGVIQLASGKRPGGEAAGGAG